VLSAAGKLSCVDVCTTWTLMWDANIESQTQTQCNSHSHSLIIQTQAATRYRIIIITSNVPAPRAETFTPAQRPGRYRGCSVLRYLRPRNLAASFAAATGTAGVTAALRRPISVPQAQPINTLDDDQRTLSPLYYDYYFA